MLEIQIQQKIHHEKPAKLVFVRSVDFLLQAHAELSRSTYDRLLATTVSHEFLSPLNCIVNQSKMLIDNKEQLGNELNRFFSMKKKKVEV